MGTSSFDVSVSSSVDDGQMTHLRLTSHVYPSMIVWRVVDLILCDMIWRYPDAILDMFLLPPTYNSLHYLIWLWNWSDNLEESNKPSMKCPWTTSSTLQTRHDHNSWQIPTAFVKSMNAILVWSRLNLSSEERLTDAHTTIFAFYILVPVGFLVNAPYYVYNISILI